MSTNKELIDQAMARLGSRKSQRLRDSVVQEINTAIDVLERGTFLPWFLQETATLVIPANTPFVTLPDNFAREQEDTRPYYFEGTTKVSFLTKRLHPQLMQSDISTLSLYSINGNEFHVRTVSTIEQTIYLEYYAKATGNLVDDENAISNPWLIDAKDWVLGKALKTAALGAGGNRQLASDMAELETAARNDVYAFHESRVHTNQDYEVGGSTNGS